MPALSLAACLECLRCKDDVKRQRLGIRAASGLVGSGDLDAILAVQSAFPYKAIDGLLTNAANGEIGSLVEITDGSQTVIGWLSDGSQMVIVSNGEIGSRLRSQTALKQISDGHRIVLRRLSGGGDLAITSNTLRMSFSPPPNCNVSCCRALFGILALCAEGFRR